MYTDKYQTEVKNFLNEINIDFLNNSTICMTGGTGLILSYLVDTILESSLNIKLILLQRNKESAYKRFSKHINNPNLIILECDITKPLEVDYPINYILSGASYTDPYNYARYPVETITTNVLANQNLFELAKKQKKLQKIYCFFIL